MSAVAIDELYALQQESEWAKTGRSARIRQLKATVAADEEGRKAHLQLTENELLELTAVHAKLLEKSIEAYRTYVDFRTQLDPITAELAIVRARARKLGLELPKADSFGDRILSDYEYRQLRDLALVATGGNW